MGDECTILPQHLLTYPRVGTSARGKAPTHEEGKDVRERTRATGASRRTACPKADSQAGAEAAIIHSRRPFFVARVRSRVCARDVRPPGARPRAPTRSVL